MACFVLKNAWMRTTDALYRAYTFMWAACQGLKALAINAAAHPGLSESQP